MFSSWSAWDFIKSYPEVINSSRMCPIGVVFYSDAIEPLILSRLPAHKFGKNNKRVMLGEQLTRDWMEQYFFGQDLFSMEESFLVLHAQNIPVDGVELLIERGMEIEKTVLFSFTKENKSTKKLFDKSEISFHKITEPRFYEGGKLLSFLAMMLDYPLPYPIQNYLLEALPWDAESLLVAITQLKNHHPDLSNVMVDEVKSLIGIQKVDQFQLATLLSQKKLNQFFEKLALVDLDYEQWRQFFVFMQGHLLKLADPTYIDKKNRPSKYDNEIRGAAGLWKEDQLLSLSAYFSDREKEAKQRSPLLGANLKKSYLKGIVIER